MKALLGFVLSITFALLSVIAVLILHNNPTTRTFLFWACSAAALGYAVVSAVSTVHRIHSHYQTAYPIRSCISILFSLVSCNLGLAISSVALEMISAELEPAHIQRSGPGLATASVALLAGVSLLGCGLIGLTFIQRPKRIYFRLVMLTGGVTIAAVFFSVLVLLIEFALTGPMDRDPQTMGSPELALVIWGAGVAVCIALIVLQLVSLFFVRPLLDAFKSPNPYQIEKES
jgi:hypothetical protein